MDGRLARPRPPRYPVRLVGDLTRGRRRPAIPVVPRAVASAPGTGAVCSSVDTPRPPGMSRPTALPPRTPSGAAHAPGTAASDLGDRLQPHETHGSCDVHQIRPDQAAQRWNRLRDQYQGSGSWSSCRPGSDRGGRRSRPPDDGAERSTAASVPERFASARGRISGPSVAVVVARRTGWPRPRRWPARDTPQPTEVNARQTIPKQGVAT